MSPRPLIALACVVLCCLQGACAAAAAATTPTRPGGIAVLDTYLYENLWKLGHRNWIAVVDSAYPAQTADGVEIIGIEAPMEDVVRVVMKHLDEAPHVTPTIFLDRECAALDEAAAPGIDAYREALEQLLADRPTERVWHEHIIAELDAAGREFTVLVIKTPSTIPYSSVFMRLECGYWDAEREAALREALDAE